MPDAQVQQIQEYCEELRDWNRYKGAIRALRAIGPPAIPALCAQLYDAEWRIRDRAIQALVGMGLAAAPALCEVLSSGNVYARWDAAHALGLIRDPRAVVDLGQALQDPSAPVRYKAAEALGAIGDARAVPALSAALLEERSGIRRHAAAALGAIGSACAVPGLCQALSDRNELVRRQAAEALRKLDGGGALPRKVIAERRMTTDQRWNALAALSQVHYVDPHITVFYYLPDLRLYCHLACLDSDLEVREGASEILEWLQTRATLLRPAAEPFGSAEAELLRPGGNSGEAREGLLRAAEKVSAEAPPRRRKPWWARFT